MSYSTYVYVGPAVVTNQDDLPDALNFAYEELNENLTPHKQKKVWVWIPNRSGFGTTYNDHYENCYTVINPEDISSGIEKFKKSFKRELEKLNNPEVVWATVQYSL